MASERSVKGASRTANGDADRAGAGGCGLKRTSRDGWLAMKIPVPPPSASATPTAHAKRRPVRPGSGRNPAVPCGPGCQDGLPKPDDDANECPSVDESSETLERAAGLDGRSSAKRAAPEMLAEELSMPDSAVARRTSAS
jgi:hypothetical protein